MALVADLHRDAPQPVPDSVDLDLRRVRLAGDTINGQRRRSLGYQSPTALYTALTVH